MGANLLLAHIRRPFDAVRLRDEPEADFEPAPLHMFMLRVPSLISPALLPETFGLIFPDRDHLFFLVFAAPVPAGGFFALGFPAGLALTGFALAGAALTGFALAGAALAAFGMTLPPSCDWGAYNTLLQSGPAITERRPQISEISLTIDDVQSVPQQAGVRAFRL